MFIDYPTFSTLLYEADRYQDVEMYIAERGWQDWMNPFDADEISKILNLIYRIAGMSLRDVRTEAGYSMEEMSRKYRIPSRTIQGWEYGERTAPEYVILLIYYTFFLSWINKEEHNDSTEQN